MRIALGAVSALLFASSLVFSAGTWRVDSSDVELAKSSVEMLLLGWLGPIAFQVGWYGNPLLLVSWILTGTGRGAIANVVCAGLATMLAASSFVTLPLWSIFGRNEGESATLASPGLGMCLWFLSFCVALGAAMAVLRARRADTAPA